MVFLSGTKEMGALGAHKAGLLRNQHLLDAITVTDTISQRLLTRRLSSPVRPPTRAKGEHIRSASLWSQFLINSTVAKRQQADSDTR